jgi:hypothetical protein
MKKRKNSGLLLAARMAAGRAARRIGARVAVAGKRVARKYGKRLATYGVNELESRGQKLLETASGSARQRIARMNPEISSSTVSKAKVDEILRSIYRKYYSDKKLKNKFHRGDKVRFGGDVYRVFDYDLAGNEVLFAIYNDAGRVHQFVPAAALTLVSAFSPNKKALAYYAVRMNPCADVSWPPHEPYQLVSRVPVYIPRVNSGTPRKAKWQERTVTRDGYREYDAVSGNFELHVKGFGPPAPVDLRGDWQWKTSVISGAYAEVKGKSATVTGAQSAAEAAVERLRTRGTKTRRNPNFPIKAVYDGGGGVGLIPVSIIGLHPNRYSWEPDLYEVVSTSKTSKVYPKGHKFLAHKHALAAPESIKRKKYGTYIVAHTHVLDEP